MEHKTNISALEELVNQQAKAYISRCTSYDVDVVQEIQFDTVKSYYEDNRMPTEEELKYLDEIELNFTEFAAHYEFITLDAPDGEICTIDSTCNLEEALKWYEEDIDGFVYIQVVDHNSMLIEFLKCNF